MKNVNILFLIFVLATSSYTNAEAQTKEETETWIVEKINKLMSKKTWFNNFYSPPSPVTYISREYIPVKFSIQDGKIIIEYYELFGVKYDGEESKNQSKNTSTAKINLFGQITNLTSFANAVSNNRDKYYGDAYLAVLLECECATFLRSSSDNKEESSMTNTYVPLFITANAEPDIINRLNKAFVHLKTFYPAPKEKF